jgi:hypothetical protein
VTSWATIVALIDQPTTRREIEEDQKTVQWPVFPTNIDDGRHIQPAFSRPDVGEVGDPFAVGRRSFEAAIQHVGSDGVRLPLTQIGRQTTPSRTRFESLQPHQSLDPTQPAIDPVFDYVAPYAPGAVSPVAAEEACTNLRAQFFVVAAALAARSRQPGIEATPRDTERSAHPIDRPYPPVLRDEGEPHWLSFAK